MPINRFSTSGRARLTIAAAALLAGGAGLGAAVSHAVQPARAMAPIAPVRIAALTRTPQPWLGDAQASVRGRVVELFGEHFVLDDGSGRALIDARGLPAGVVTTGQPVTAQGRVVPGGLQARFLVTADGRITTLGGAGRRPHHGEGRRHDHGHGDQRDGATRPVDADHPAGAGGAVPAPGAPR